MLLGNKNKRTHTHTYKQTNKLKTIKNRVGRADITHDDGYTLYRVLTLITQPTYITHAYTRTWSRVYCTNMYRKQRGRVKAFER